ncbi:ABC transporter permease [Geminicoccus harenae]|uniref:ABC transporter permease n=1 Tax=Geminicoccus harenae TaxID=2498453 RepID=UPI00168ACBF7|nr:ABC transporter permease [Geminicoccus harenae]
MSAALARIPRPVAALLLALAIHLIGMALIRGFGTMFGIRAMLVLATLLAIAAIGQTLVIIIGGIDLSIPFVIGFANVTAAQLYGDGVPFAVVLPLVLAVAMAIGAFNGMVSASLAIHPLIVTLGTGTALQGAVQLWTAGFPTGAAPSYVTSFVSIGGSIGPIPVPWLIPAFLVLAAVVILALGRTVYGRRLYALGSNPRAARLALVDPVRTWTITFALSAGFAALTGVLLLGFSGAAYARVGEPYLFQTIAAVVIGGTTLIGGRGGYLGTIAGALCLIELTTVLVGLGLRPPLVQATLGVTIVALVAIYGREAHVRELI